MTPIEETKELETWRSEWAELGGREDLVRMLTERVVKDSRRIRRGMVVEVVASVFVCAFALWVAIMSEGKPVNVAFTAGIFLFCGVWLTRLFTLREGSKLGAGLDGFVALTRRRLDDDLRWIRFSFRTQIVVALASTAWAIWVLSVGWAFYRAEPWRGVVGFGGIYVILGGVYAALRERRRKILAERERFEALVADKTLT